MRTSDFSLAPRQARADVVVVLERAGAARAWQRGARRAARGASGHRWDTAYRLRDGARGVIAWFTTADDAAAFLATRPTDGERHRALHAEPEGYTNGVWRAEGDVMAHVERFTPVTREVERGTVPPLVAAPGPARRAGARPARPRGAGVPEVRSPADAQALFVGATRYRGPHSWALLSREWYPMVAAMRRLPGYVWHGVYWEPPFTLGTIAFFATRDDLLVFARVPAHRRLMRWVTQGRRHGTGGWIRLHQAAPEVPAAREDGGR
ncbi:hypothetical protein [Actinotalea solisilvae]|uniref:hypothetical protein n=1 Tax=Actinotalea solisilvae TaxID=2072922 RepID=UPI0018F1FA4C|nr:hypothetical protein [Actinotalea solisilvae]